MCIIVAKPMGVKMPDNETLRECFDNNPDGAGIAWSDGKIVRIIKGLMSYKTLKNTLKTIDNPTSKAVIIHCRIATSGGIRKDVTHPYPVTDDISLLRRVKVTDSIALAHNGVINGMDTDKTTSDTMAFVRDVAAPMRRLCPDLLHNDDALSILETVAASKLALLNSAGDLVTLGTFVEDKGIYYSNTSYLPYIVGINRRGDSAYQAWHFNDLWYDVELYKPCDDCMEYADCWEYGAACKSADEAAKTAKAYPATNKVRG